jgi:hypothetical protein
VLSSFLGSSSEIIQVSENNVREIMENISHVPFKRQTYVFWSKRHDTIRKSSPWGGKCDLILICGMDLDFIVAGKPIHEGQGLVVRTVLNNLVNKRLWEVFFGTRIIEIAKVGADMNIALFFVDRDGIGDP